MTEVSSQLKEKILQELQTTFGEERFDTWRRTLNLEQIDEGKVVVLVPNKYYQSFVEKRLCRQIKDVFLRVVGRYPNIVFDITSSDSDTNAASDINNNLSRIIEKYRLAKIHNTTTHTTIYDNYQPPQLNKNYTFENFVVGPTNILAHASSVSVSQNPGAKYNPLFIYGSVGLGKTHLMQAICHSIIKNFPRKRIAYISSETFLNEYISAIQSRLPMGDFRNKYRNIDVLVVDDMHFLSNKEHLQEEFFHTFDALYNSEKQIILSSDSPPNEIPKLDERLVSRFSWGLSVKIEPPSFEVRVAILKKKAELSSAIIPDDVINYVADIITDNVRLLESAINMLTATSVLLNNNKPIDVNFAKSVLADIGKQKSERYAVTPDIIQECVSKYYKVELEDLKGRKWNKSVSLAKQVAIYLTKLLTNCSLIEIGSWFGGRDHSSVIYSLRKIEKLAKFEPQIKADVEFLIKNISQINSKHQLPTSAFGGYPK